MSLLEQASLVITPNAVEEGKLFSIVHTDGSGDLSVVRATIATEVGSDGLIQDVPYNLSKNSQQVGVGTWSGQNFTISTEPSGFFPFDLSATCIKGINSVVGFNQIYNTSVSTIIGTTYTLTGFLKSDNTPYYFFDLPFVGANVRVVYDNINKQIITLPIGVTVNINDIGSGWIEFRITSTATLVNNLGSLKVYCSTSSTVFTTGVPVGTTIYATKIQLITGTEPKEYFPTTDRLNVARLDYTNSTCPSILVEPQRTNLALYSEQFDNEYWAKTGSTISANAINSPNGTLTADRLVDNISTGGHFVEKIIYASSGANTLSVFCKKDNNRYIELCTASALLNSARFIFDFDTKTITSFGAIGTTITYVSSNITELQDGWFRLSLTFSIVSSTIIYYSFTLSDSPNVGTTNLVSYTGDGTKGVYIWGAQVEAGSNATSYIPTVASAVTRNADVISKTGLTGITTITETFENGTTNVISGSPTSYTMSQGRIKQVIGL